MEVLGTIVTILLSALVLISGATFGLIGFLARKIDRKLDKNDDDHNFYNTRLALGDEKLKKVEEHEDRLDGHDEEIKDIKTKIKYKIVG